MRWRLTISRVVVGFLVLGVTMAQTQPTVRAAEPPPAPNAYQVASLQKPPAKLSSHLDGLVQAVRTATRTLSPAEQNIAASLAPSGAGSLSRDANNNPVLDVRVIDTSQQVLDELKAHGADILSVSPQYRNVTLAIDQSHIVDLSNLSSVEYVAEVIRPMIKRSRDFPFNVVASAPAERPANTTCGSIISEADTQLGAENGRTQFSVDGTGIKVGVLSDSFASLTSPTSAAVDVTTGDLPGPGNPCGRTTAVQIVKDTVSGDDEGRAMAQAVHDLAPGAALAFATAFVSETDFAAQITALRTAGANVITDDVTYFAEPFYQDGPIAVAANTARAAGVFLTSSASNDNAKTGGTTGTDWNGYEALAFRPTFCPAPLPANTICHNFSGVGSDPTYGFTLANTRSVSIDLQWAEPQFGVTQDIDLYLINIATNTTVAVSLAVNPTSGKPFEFVSHTNSTGAAESLAVVIRQFSGTATPRLKLIFPLNGSTGVSNIEYAMPTAAGDTVGGTMFGHNAAVSELSVAATPYNDGLNTEYYSSHGPATYLFGPVNGTTPASPISPVTKLPDITATDGGKNTFFGQFTGGFWRFFGTSQAAPHAAGVAALLRQRGPSATPDQIKNALTGSATAMNGGPAVVGAGRVNAVGALGIITPPCPSPRPAVGRSVTQVNPNRLQVNLTSTAGGFTSITTTRLLNATLEVNGTALPLNNSRSLTGTNAAVFVNRVGAGAFTAQFSVVDGSCPGYSLFFGKGS